MATSEFPLTLAHVDQEILKRHRLVASSPRSDPVRPILLRQLAVLRNYRYGLSHEKGDLDESITHCTETVLLPFQPSQDVVKMFFRLASDLSSRFNMFKQPEDIKSSLKYFRFLRINFHPLEAFGISHDQFTSRLVHVLAQNLALGSGDMIQELEETEVLIHEFLASDVLTYGARHALNTFINAVTKTEIFYRKHAQHVADRVIQMLREAMVLKPHLEVSYAVAVCLAARFQTTCELDDYEEAIDIADKILATHSLEDSLTPTLTPTRASMITPIRDLLVYRSNSYSRPEYLEDAIRRIRNLLRLPSLPDQVCAELATDLDRYVSQRFSYFGVAGNLGETPPASFLPDITIRGFGGTLDELLDIRALIGSDGIADVEAAVERSRTLLELLPPQPGPSYERSLFSALVFAEINYDAYQCTRRLDYLNEAITTYRDLRKVSAPKSVYFRAGYGLLESMIARCCFPTDNRRQDFDDVMRLYPELVNDESAEASARFTISYCWTHTARMHGLPSTVTCAAYETAMSLMQETLVFSPTLQTQHFRLTYALRGREGLPSDYASYQIETGQFKRAMETLERGRALLWSEMRGLRTSTDQLRAADPALADKFADINQRLNLVTTSVAQSEIEEMGDSGTGTERGEGLDSIGHLVTTQRRLVKDRNFLISRIQSLPDLQNFLKTLSFDVLSSAAAHGPVIIINQSQFSSHILLLLKDSPPSVIFPHSNFHDRANQLKDELLRLRKETGLDSKDYNLTLVSVLADLYELIGKPVIQRLRRWNVPEKSRLWWCPTDSFCSLPLHAMGPIPSGDGKDLYFSDLYITSYTPTISALIDSRKPGSLSGTIDNPKPPLLLVAQPDTLPGAWGEIETVQTTKIPVTTLISEMATPKSVVEGLRDHRFAHFVCHGLLETGKPFDASLELHSGNNLTLLDIVRSELPAAEFAFLSACHTAELTEDSVADEGLHLAAAMQYCGFRSVVGTMWAMADTDGADLSKHFYKSIFSDKANQNGVLTVPYYERSARALQLAVKKLRRKRGITLERWVNFVHYGA